MFTIFIDFGRQCPPQSAIFGFTFHIGRMTEVLTPDIYIELTGKNMIFLRVKIFSLKTACIIYFEEIKFYAKVFEINRIKYYSTWSWMFGNMKLMHFSC